MVCVMNDFIGTDAPTDMEFHHPDMLADEPVASGPRMLWRIGANVAIAVNVLTALPRGMVRPLPSQERTVGLFALAASLGVKAFPASAHGTNALHPAIARS